MSAFAQTYETLWSSENGRWFIYRSRVTGRLFVADENTGYAEWPTHYGDGRIAWDWPERVPAYVKRATARFI